MEKRQLALATRTSGPLLELQAGTGQLGLVLEMGLLFMLPDARVAVVVGMSSFCKSSGTFFMLSDEAFGREQLDARSDLFSFGAVLYEMPF